MAAEKDTSKKTESEKVLAAGKAPAEEWIENGTKHIKTKKWVTGMRDLVKGSLGVCWVVECVFIAIRYDSGDKTSLLTINSGIRIKLEKCQYMSIGHWNEVFMILENLH